METKLNTSTRRYDLDWLRTLSILTVFIFHSGRFFDTGGWHVKNATTYLGVQVWTSFLASWMMPFIFVISGASLFYALGRAGTGKFVKDKVLRLLVPFVVGVFTHVTVQVYLERHTQGGFQGSYFEFLPHYFEGLYGFGGNFAWIGLHLWYLLVLFIFSLLLYPLFRWLKGGAGAHMLHTFGQMLAAPGVIYLLALPIMLIFSLVDPDSLLGNRSFGGWGLAAYIPFFLYGFLIVSHEGLQKRIQQWRWVSLAAGIVMVGVLLAVWGSAGDPTYGTTRYALVFSLLSLTSWCWVLAFLGLGMHYLNRTTPLLRYANEAVLPFYVMHQTVILCVGYFVVSLALPDLVKFVVIAIVSFATIMGLYEFVIRRVNVLRFLFGMKSTRRAAPAPQAPKLAQAGSR